MIQKGNPKLKIFSKKILILIFGAIVLHILILYMLRGARDNAYNNNKFRFENFKTVEELKKAINANFQIGSNGNRAKEFLEKHGASCLLFKNKDDLTKQGWECDYGNWSLHQGVKLYFRVNIYVDEHFTITKISVSRKNE